MLRATSQFFGDLPTDKHIYDAFLGLSMPSLTSLCATWTSAAPTRSFLCRNCQRLVGEDSLTPEQTGLPLKKCKCSRQCYEIKRLVVLDICSEIVVSNRLRCNTTDERMTLCKKCWNAERRTDNGKKVRHRFSARYGTVSGPL